MSNEIEQCPYAEMALAAMIDNPAIGVTVIDITGRIISVNPRAASLLFSKEPAALVSMPLTDVLPDALARERLTLIKQIHRSGKPILYRYIHRGLQLQSSMHAVTGPVGGLPRVLAITTVGAPEPSADPGCQEFEIVESSLADFGRLEQLTRRELEVLAFLRHGMTICEIAVRLHRSRKTIDNHRQSIGKKLGESCRVRLAQIADHAGLEIADAGLMRLTSTGHRLPQLSRSGA